MLEEELKYHVDARFALPDLTGCLPDGGRVAPRPAVTLHATYYDTADLRLARSGVSLRFRRGDGAMPWTVKLPTDTPGTRHEIDRPGAAGTVPAELISLVTAYTRGAAVTPMATLRTTRVRYELRDRDDQMLAEVADDTVAVLDGRRIRMKFREVEVERRTAKPKLLRGVGEALEAAGAAGGCFVAKYVRALGDAALGAPDLPSPAALPEHPTAADVVTDAMRRDIGRVFAHDPLVRLRANVAGGDTAVHQMRVGVRRLRSNLRTFAPLLVDSRADPLRDELRWLGGVLGAARDAEVLRARLRRTAAADVLAPLDESAVARIDADLAARHEDARVSLDEALNTPRYRALVETLYEVATDPLLRPAAARSAARVLPRLAARDWQRLVLGGHGVEGAGELDPLAPDDDWHAVRIRAKRARYAVETVAGVAGVAAVELSRALASVTDLLGAHADACVAGEAWLAIAAADPDDHLLAVTAGRLYERERATAREVRQAYRPLWRATRRRRLTSWM